MDAADDTGKAITPERAMAAATEATTAASKPVSDHRFGPDAAAILPPSTGVCWGHGRCCGPRR
jgi:hypothetical protein